MYFARSLVVARYFGDDGLDLLISGRHQEGPCAAIGLRTDNGKARLRMRKLLYPARRHGSARMKVRIDQWSECAGRLYCGIEIKPDFPEERKIGPEPRNDDDPVDCQV
jgi:hypothetical protein